MRVLLLLFLIVSLGAAAIVAAGPDAVVAEGGSEGLGGPSQAVASALAFNLCNSATVSSEQNETDPSDNSTTTCVTFLPSEGTVCNNVSISGNEHDPDTAKNHALVCSDFEPALGTTCNTAIVATDLGDPDGSDNAVTVCSTIAALNPDVNGDGEVTVDDLLVVTFALGTQPPSPPQSDVNGDGVVNVYDLVLVAQRL